MFVEPMSHYRRWVGGSWPEVQKWQFDFITQQMLAYHPEKTFLDIGCGSLRLGAKLIPHHGVGKYIGLDTSHELINYGLDNEIRPGTVEEKKPRFIVTSEFDYSELGDEKVDIAWAFQLWFHLPLELFKQGLRNTREVLKDDGALFSSFTSVPPDPEMEKPTDDYVYDYYQRVFWRWPEDLPAIFNECGLSYEYRGSTIRAGNLIRSVKI
jgi:SAM-dependent methyltransferase